MGTIKVEYAKLQRHACKNIKQPIQNHFYYCYYCYYSLKKPFVAAVMQSHYKHSYGTELQHRFSLSGNNVYEGLDKLLNYLLTIQYITI